jgi:DNA-binding NarL/FixJ family response regulator
VVTDGRALVRDANELKPDLIYVTMNLDADVVTEAFARGASGYLLKTCAASEMVLAVRVVLRGKTYLSKARCRDTIDCIC